MDIKCKRCKNKWNYTGKKKPGKYSQFVVCPKCHTSVTIPKEMKK